MRRIALAATALALALAGCAAGESSDGDDDTGSATATTSTTDAGTATDTSSTTDASTALDTGVDTTPTMVCDPSDAPTCLDAATVQSCSSDGAMLEETACTSAQLCEDGACIDREMVCTPSEARCIDSKTAATCSADGFEETMVPCGQGNCVAGECRTGLTTGERCTMHDECAGAVCKCAEGACPGTPLEEGYCTTEGCDVGGCGAGEFCINFGLGANAGPHECILDCNRNCSRAGFGCVALPSGAGATQSWEEVCFQADFPKPVGATCATDAECAGGLCLTMDSSGDTVEAGYCSAPCETQAGCPTDSACVVYPGFNGDVGFCVLSCIDNDCPPQRPETIDTTCLFATIPEGGTSNVCWQQ